MMEVLHFDSLHFCRTRKSSKNLDDAQTKECEVSLDENKGERYARTETKLSGSQFENLG